MIEKFQRATKQDPNEEFSYHLCHIAASQDDESAPSYFSFTQTFWNLTWDAIPAELQSVSVPFRSPVCRGSKKTFTDSATLTSQ
jgi:hypothetical protein